MPKPTNQEMQSSRTAKPGPKTSQYLDIAEIRDDTVVMKDGTLRAVLLTSSINFALKSEEEQAAIIQAYMSFLNTMEYPIQIVIQSRRMNIDNYLDRLQATKDTQTNELLKAQISDYVSFIKELVQYGDIMSKKFYVVVSYNPLSDKRKGFFERVREVFTPASSIRLQDKVFIERKGILMSRVGHVQTGLGSMSVQGVVLDTQSLIELYYNAYNPETSETQKLGALELIQAEG
ncbi:MAG: hypothetical protein V1821_03050 [bacterium]